MKISCLTICTVLVFCVLAGCDSAGEKPPISVPTPVMPDGWRVVESFLANQTTLNKFSEQMHAELLGVRNTTFAIDSVQVKVNTLVAANAADADSAMGYLGGMKSEDALYRTGTTIYEFVGSSKAEKLIAAGREHLQKPKLDLE